MSGNAAERDMVEGYLDGFKDHRETLPENSNFSPAYIHGWLNGRDDRVGTPRDTASALRERAELLINGAAS